MEVKLNAGRPEVRTVRGIVRDLKAAGQNIPDEEQGLNVIRTLPDIDL